MTEKDQILHIVGEAVGMVLKPMEERLCALEQKLSDTGAESYGKRLHNFKDELDKKFRSYRDEIKELLAKHHEERAEVPQAVQDALQNMQNYAGMLHQGLTRSEARLNAIWNTFNGFIRFMENILVTSQHRNMNSFFDNFPVNRKEFEDRFRTAGEEVFQEAMAAEKALFAALKEAKKTGGIPKEIPTPHPMSTAEAVHKSLTESVVAGIKENKAMIIELNQLKEEAAKDANRG